MKCTMFSRVVYDRWLPSRGLVDPNLVMSLKSAAADARIDLIVVTKIVIDLMLSADTAVLRYKLTSEPSIITKASHSPSSLRSSAVGWYQRGYGLKSERYASIAYATASLVMSYSCCWKPHLFFDCSVVRAASVLLLVCYHSQ